MSNNQESVAVAERLRSFLRRAAELQHREPSGSPGLLCFLQRAGPLLHAPRDVVDEAPRRPAPPALEPERLRKIVAALAKPLSRAPPLRPALNVWSVAALKRDELRNAAVLAWLLHPHGSHGFGPTVLRAFLDEVARGTPDWPQIADDLSRVSVLTEEWPLGSETDRVDIAIDGPNFTLFVEVKIDAPEGPDQLLRYADLVRRKAQALKREHGRVIYLCSRPPQNPPPGVAIITWREIAQVLLTLPRDGLAGILTMQFARHVRAFF